MQKVFSIFAQNLAYYNEGSIEGGWLDLPQSPEVIDKYLKEVVKVDDEHEEYEIADIDDNISPFPYASIQWSSVKELNELAIIFSKLDECQREAIQAYLVYSGEEHYSISQLVNICLQADNINYCRYSFEGLEYNQDCSPELKMGYTMAEENGIYIQLQKQGIIDYFDFEKYGESFGYDYELLSNGYFIPNYDIDLDCYSKEETQEKMNEILNEKLKEQEVSEIEI